MTPIKKLRKGDKVNFQTLRQACDSCRLALMPSVRKSDGKQVALVCAMNFDGEDYYPVPLAVMVEGNPFDLFEDPTQ
jgi:hypothetical protein